MEIFEINESFDLKGQIKIQGAKNSVLKLMAASLLCPGKHRFANCPDITDVSDMLQILRNLGVKGNYNSETAVLDLEIPEEINFEFDSKLIDKMRASITLLGPLLSKGVEFDLPFPGGDDFGDRPIDIHVRCLNELGASVEVDGVSIRSNPNLRRLIGNRVVLEYPSHTATDNLLMASVTACGTTVIENAAREPEIVDLCSYLISLGAKIEGGGTSRVVVEGVEKLFPSQDAHIVIGDRVEAATYMCAVGACGGSVYLDGIDYTYLDTLIYKLKTVGLDINSTGNGLMVSMKKRPKAVNVSTLPFPGIATDYKPTLVAMLAVADGVSMVTENIFVGRFRYVEELQKMNADILVEGHHMAVTGKPRLKGATVRAYDIRAGASLIIAGMNATDTTIIENVDHILRGYEKISEKFKSLGANIRFLPDV